MYPLWCGKPIPSAIPINRNPRGLSRGNVQASKLDYLGQSIGYDTCYSDVGLPSWCNGLIYRAVGTCDALYPRERLPAVQVAHVVRNGDNTPVIRSSTITGPINISLIMPHQTFTENRVWKFF